MIDDGDYNDEDDDSDDDNNDYDDNDGGGGGSGDGDGNHVVTYYSLNKVFSVGENCFERFIFYISLQTYHRSSRSI